MNSVFYILFVLLGVGAVFSQEKSLPVSEFQTLMFITDATGTNATLLNPGGLASYKSDDGVYANYNFTRATKVKDSNFSFSMGNMGFAYQNLVIDSNQGPSELNYYRIGLAIGGKVFSFGSSNKIIEFNAPGAAPARVFSLDAGFIFNPTQWLTLSGFGRDLDEPLVGSYQFKRAYTAGISLNLPDNIVRLMLEGHWNDDIIYFDDADFKAGIAVAPFTNHKMELLVGGIRNIIYDDQYFAMLYLPLLAGIRAVAAARINQDLQPQRYFVALHFPLQTVTF